MTELTGDPVEQAVSWLHAHEFPDAERVALGSSVLGATSLRCRVWQNLPTADELTDLLESTPDSAWCVVVLRRDPDQLLTSGDLADQIAALVLDRDGAMRAGNERAHQLIEWVGARQRAQSFAQRALHVLADERPGVVEALSVRDGDGAREAKEPNLPIRSTTGTGIHDTPATPMLAVRAAIEDPVPEPTQDDLAAADAVQRKRIEEMRRQRELRKSVKHR